jgi:hypothetical protein
LGPYARLLRTPDAVLPLLASFAGALPIGMLGLATLLLVRGATGSLAEGSAAAGALTAGNAVGVAIQGHLIDRHGQTPVLVSAAVCCAVSLALFVVAVTGGGQLVLTGFLALLAGASIPATTSSMRALWPLLVSDRDLRTAAYALLAVMFTAALVIGPLLVSVLLLVAGAASAVLAAGGLAAGAGLLFASTHASRRWRPVAGGRPWVHRPSPALRTLLVAALGSGLANGLVYVGVPAVTIAHHAPALAGVLFGLAAAGDLVGGLLYGARSWPLALPSRLPILQGASAVLIGCLGLTASPWGLAPLMLVAGAVSAPGSIATSTLLDVAVPRPRLTESYTLLIGAGLSASSVGYAAGGSLVQAGGSSSAVFAAGAFALTCAAAWTFVQRHTLRSPERPMVLGRETGEVG